MYISGKVLTPEGFINGTVGVENGIITAVEHTDCRTDGIVIPGLIDTHIHGAFGCDFTLADTQDIVAAVQKLALHGTTSVMATTVTMPLDELKAAFARIAQAQKQCGIIGVNMEGPFFMPEKCGAQNTQYLCGVDAEAVEYLLTVFERAIICFDPLADGADELIKRFAGRAVLSLAHTACGYDAALACFTNGAKRITHALNCTEPWLSRTPGAVGAAYTAGAYAELICDGIHLHPATLSLMLNAFADKAVMISDAVSACGMPDGEYSLSGAPVSKQGGVMRTKNGALAGAAGTLLDNLRRTVNAGIPLERAVRAASTNAAKSVGLTDRGEIAAGKRADLLVLDDNLNLKSVVLGGETIR